MRLPQLARSGLTQEVAPRDPDDGARIEQVVGHPRLPRGTPLLADRCGQVRPRRNHDRTSRRLEWLERRGVEHGFAVVVATVEVVREPVARTKGGFWLDRSEFSGVVEIVNPEKVAAAMRTGIGGGRAWGLGMLRLIEKREG